MTKDTYISVFCSSASCSTFWIVDVLHVRFGLSTLTVRDSFLAYPYAVTSCRYVYVTAMYLLSPSVLDTQGEFPRQVLRATIHDTQINFVNQQLCT